MKLTNPTKANTKKAPAVTAWLHDQGIDGINEIVEKGPEIDPNTGQPAGTRYTLSTYHADRPPTETTVVILEPCPVPLTK